MYHRVCIQTLLSRKLILHNQHPISPQGSNKPRKVPPPGERPMLFRHLFRTLLLLVSVSLCAQDVLTYHNNIARTGLNNNETILTPANVAVATFGKLFTVPADGLVDAQPLILNNVSISGVVRNLL